MSASSSDEPTSSQARRNIPRRSIGAHPTYDVKKRFKEIGPLESRARPSRKSGASENNAIDVLSGAPKGLHSSPELQNEADKHEQVLKPILARPIKLSMIIRDEEDDEMDGITSMPQSADPTKKPTAGTIALIDRMGIKEAAANPFDAFQSNKAKTAARRSAHTARPFGKTTLTANTKALIADREHSNKLASERKGQKIAANLEKRKAEIDDEIENKRQRLDRELEAEQALLIKAAEEEAHREVENTQAHFTKDLTEFKEAVASPAKGK